MSTIPPTPEAEQAALEALRASYPGWHINRAAFGGYKAEWRSQDALTIRVVAGTSLADLRSRLETVEQARAESE